MKITHRVRAGPQELCSLGLSGASSGGNFCMLSLETDINDTVRGRRTEEWEKHNLRTQNSRIWSGLSKASCKLLQNLDLMSAPYVVQGSSLSVLLQAPGQEALVGNLAWLWWRNCSWDLQGQWSESQEGPHSPIPETQHPVTPSHGRPHILPPRHLPLAKALGEQSAIQREGKRHYLITRKLSLHIS